MLAPDLNPRTLIASRKPDLEKEPSESMRVKPVRRPDREGNVGE